MDNRSRTSRVDAIDRGHLPEGFVSTGSEISFSDAQPARDSGDWPGPSGRIGLLVWRWCQTSEGAPLSGTICTPPAGRVHCHGIADTHSPVFSVRPVSAQYHTRAPVPGFVPSG